MPLPYQVAVILLTALFLWTFSISRDPRGWRRLYQSKFAKKEDFSVNRNKRIDETIKKYGIVIAMIFLVIDVGCFVMGVTDRYRNNAKVQTMEDRFRNEEVDRIRANMPKESRRPGAQ